MGLSPFVGVRKKRMYTTVVQKRYSDRKPHAIVFLVIGVWLARRFPLSPNGILNAAVEHLISEFKKNIIAYLDQRKCTKRLRKIELLAKYYSTVDEFHLCKGTLANFCTYESIARQNRMLCILKTGAGGGEKK